MKKILGAAASVVTIAGIGTAPGVLATASAAPAKAKVSVTLQGDDPFGTVKSKRATCRSGVTVVLFRQVGAKGGADDKAKASDTTDADGDFDFGNPGLADGRYYAKVKLTNKTRPVCKPGISPTIKVDKN